MTSIYLEFSPDFPATIAGELIELSANKKSNKISDPFYILGKVSYADIQFLPPEDKEIKKHYNSISRIHCTIRYDKKYKIWELLDGGVYLSDGDNSPGEEYITPSTNGVFINGQRIRVNDWHTIVPGDRIHFGNDKKIVVHATSTPTINVDIWENENWVCRGFHEVSESPLRDKEDLVQHTKDNANPSATTTPWGLVSKIFDWFVTPSATKETQFIKLFLCSVILAIVFNYETKQFFAWIIQKLFN